MTLRIAPVGVAERQPGCRRTRASQWQWLLGTVPDIDGYVYGTSFLVLITLSVLSEFAAGQSRALMVCGTLLMLALVTTVRPGCHLQPISVRSTSG